MLNTEQETIAVGLIRKKAKILRGEEQKALRLVNSLVWAHESQIPEDFLLTFNSALSVVIHMSRFDPASLPPVVGALANKNKRCRTSNLIALDLFGARIENEYSVATEETVLSGNGAALSVLYNDPGAFPATEFAALLDNGTYVNGRKRKKMKPLSEEWSERIQIGNNYWRKPKPELLVALLAQHIGDPGTNPALPMWPHLGTALLLWRDKISLETVVDLGKQLTVRAEVERGLAIAAYIFPELTRWIETIKLKIPRWEKKYAIPLAAKRIVQGGRN